MPGMYKLSVEAIEGSLGALERYANKEAIEAVIAIATALKNSGDSNPLIEQCLEAGKKFEGIFNQFTESADGFIGDAKQVIDMTEYLQKKAHVGEVSNRDASFKNQNIDTSSVMI